MNKKTVLKTCAVVFGALVLLCAVFYAAAYSEYLEYLEIGEKFIKVFATNISVYAISFAAAAVIAFAMMLSNLFAVRSNSMHVDTTVRFFENRPFIAVFSAVFALAFAYCSAGGISGSFLQFINSEWFSLGDPIFNRDVGYYVFQRPFYISIINSLSYFTAILIAVNLVAYFFIYAGHGVREMKGIINEKGIMTHIITSIILFFLVKAVSYRFTADMILFKEGNNGLTGASYTDIAVWLKFYRIAPALLLISVVLAIYLVLRSRHNMAILSVCIYPAAFIAVSVLSGLTGTAVVRPNEFEASSEYIGYNINFTRAAYGLDKSEFSDIRRSGDLNSENILKNAATVNNIRLADYKKNLDYLNETQSGGGNYVFSDTDTAVYDINGEKTSVALSAREIDLSKINSGNLSYEDRVYKYTHGVGAVMYTDNGITPGGTPQLVIRDIPPRSANGAPAVTEPRIYYGETTDSYCITGTKEKEYDKLEPEDYFYNGNGGIALNFPTRLIYSVKLGDSKLLFSNKISAQSKLLVNRNVIERVKTVAPFFTYDKNPYLLIDKGGRLKWIVDIYTTSRWFPYSQYSGSYNYIRNSAKAVVDAYGGTVEFYITDDSDPIINCYRKIYPTLFERTPLPSDYIEHIKYPEALFKLKANLYKSYHVTDPETFYKKSDLWVFAKERTEGEGQSDIEPSYSFVNLDGAGEKLIMSVPYSAADSESIKGFFTVSSDYSDYGRTVFYTVPDSASGLLQIDNRISANSDVAQSLAMLNQDKGMSFGKITAVPIEGNFLYLKPVYVSTEGSANAYARLKKVIAVYNEKIVCDDTLSDCLKQLFGVNKTMSSITDQTVDDIISDVLDSFDNVKLYSAENDWENYGKAMEELEYNMGNLRSAAQNKGEN